MIKVAIDKDENYSGVARMLGLKTDTVVPKECLKEHFSYITSYLKNN